MTPEEEAKAKAEHEEDKTNCVWPHPEHDYQLTHEDDEIAQLRCPRCGAETTEESE